MLLLLVISEFAGRRRRKERTKAKTENYAQSLQEGTVALYSP